MTHQVPAEDVIESHPSLPLLVTLTAQRDLRAAGSASQLGVVRGLGS